MAIHKTESEFRKAQARSARSTLIRLKHRLAANEELWSTEEEFEENLELAITTGNAKMLDAAEVLRKIDGQP